MWSPQPRHLMEVYFTDILTWCLMVNTEERLDLKGFIRMEARMHMLLTPILQVCQVKLQWKATQTFLLFHPRFLCTKQGEMVMVALIKVKMPAIWKDLRGVTHRMEAIQEVPVLRKFLQINLCSDQGMPWLGGKSRRLFQEVHSRKSILPNRFHSQILLRALIN